MPPPHQQPPSREGPTRWTLADLIDYELLLDDDKLTEPTQLEARDASIRRATLGGLSDEAQSRLQSNTPETRRRWLHHWLTARRGAENDGAESTGTTVASSLSSLGWIVMVIGFFLGIASLLGLLAAPQVIDVKIALLVYLAPQLLLFLLALFTLLRQRFGWPLPAPPILLRFFSKGVACLWQWWRKKFEDTISDDEKNTRYQAGANLLLSRSQLRSEALRWPLLQLAQKAGVSFAATIAIGMFIAGVFSNFNFGWGTSWDKVDAGVVHGAVRSVAAPWAWLLTEEIGYPSLKEVHDSQTYRGQPLPDDFPRLSSWWTFLCLSLFFWALVPRLGLLGYSWWRGRRALGNETFSDRRSDRLFRRLAKPRIQQPDPAPLERPETLTKSYTAAAPPASGEPPASPETVPPACCEVFTELDLTREDRENITSRINGRLGLGVSSFHRVYTPAEQQQGLARLADLRWADGTPRLLLLCRASDPIVANLKRLTKNCLSKIGLEGHLIIALVGKSDLAGGYLDPEDLEVWTGYADRLKSVNPNVEIEVLTGSTP